MRRRDVLAVLVLLAVMLVCYHSRSVPDSGPADGTAAGVGRLVAPVPGGRVTSGFGARWGAMHGGTDVAAPIGTPIRAVADGTVTVAGPASGFGLWMQVRHRDGTVTVYGHMNTIDRKVGDRVRAGDRIATVGQRGQSTGPHLHLEVWPGGQRSKRVDPVGWFRSHHASITTGGA